MRKFIDINDFFPDEKLVSENFEVFKKKFHYENGDYYENVILYDRKQSRTMMDNSNLEIDTCKKFIDNANGDVLIFGLGLGFVVFPLLRDDSIKSIKIVEFDSGVIDMIEPIIKKYDPFNKVKIVQGDVFNYHKSMNSKFDSIWIDIWNKFEESERKEAIELYNIYINFVNDGGYIDYWSL